ncbi:GAF domain-containing protein [Pseudoflavitalea sp. X16]|uniref:sensor histidine kinase n=1 Tax=Paraflavitalea devenefica TaxID=2716334 RepID=UPI0014211C50|nr:triple tyrosine motif-containing protein [Paraflavitalea devenefica]NII29424.1 GAF domain-containing protein [Paraflavitalea devenefica]
MNAKLPYILSFWVLMLCIIAADAQLPDYHIRLFDESFGIRTVGLRRMTKDQHGFVWLMYHNRVKRFDGKRIREFFFGERHNSILCDRENQVWVSSPDKLYLFKDDHTGFKEIEVDTVARLQLGVMFQLPGRPVWLLTARGLYAYDAQAGKFSQLKTPFPGSYPFNTRQYALSTYNHFVFYASATYIYRNNTATSQCDSLPVSELYSVNALNEQQALVTDWKNQSFLYDFSSQKTEPVNIRQYLSPITDDFLAINDVINLDTNRHLLATTKGLLEYNSNTGQYVIRRLFYKGQPLSNQEGLVDLYLDSDRQVWGCSDFSLLSFNPVQQGIGLIRNWETDPAKLFSNHIRGFAADEKENLWLATINGIAYFDIQRGTIQPIFPVAGATDRMNHPSIRGLVYDGRYVIIGQTNRGIWLYEPSSGKYRRPAFPAGPAGDSLRRKLEEDFIDQIYTLHNGHHVVAARDGGYLLNGKDYTIAPLHFPGEKENLNFCYQDSRQQVWIGTGKGVHCLDSNLAFRFSVKEGFAGVARCMYQLTNNEYILGAKGLYRVQQADDKARLEKINPYFDNIAIHSIYKDHAGRLWLATDDGLYRYNLQSKKVEYFDQFDNIQGNHFYQNSAYYSRQGILFLGGFNGINYFNPETVRAAEDSLQVTITGVSVNNDDSSYIQYAGTPKLNYFQNSVDIDFVAPYFSNTGRVQYRYRLKGLDNNWVHNGNNNTVRFSSLSPGSYTFTVAASMGGEKWFETSRPFSFVIRPPFWSTWWFRLLAITAALILLYRWIQSLREKIRAEKVLNYFATSLYGQNTAEDIFWDVARNCIAQLQFEDCVIYEYDEPRRLLVQKAAWGPKNPVRREIYNPLEIPLGSGIVGAVAQTGKAEIVNNTLKDERYIVDDRRRLSEITVPIMVEGKLFGVIDSEHPRRNFYTKRHLRLLLKIADTCATKLSKYLAEEKLRSKIARDLHDEMGSTLTSINIISKLAMQQTTQQAAMQHHLQRIKDHSTRMMESMSDIVWAINPANDTFERIIIKLKEFTAEMLEPARMNYYFTEDEQLNSIKLNLEQRKDIYLIYKEAINNTVKYSEATEVTVTLCCQNGYMRLLITDNGKGFDTVKVYSGNGIKNMHSRAAELQAQLTIESIQGAGTTVMLQLPVT